MTLRINYGRWYSMLEYGPFAAHTDSPLYIQFSGGLTSGFMACMAPDLATITYQNTGREHEKTLEFIQRVGDALKREIVWLEWRPPLREGYPPDMFKWERVDFTSAARKGEPFYECMKALAAYRRFKGEEPIAPWARQRLCTTYLKHRVLDHYVRDQGVHAHDRWIGLRADEEHRVAGLRMQQTRDKGLHVPLYEAGLSVWDIRAFWEKQSFGLGIESFRGNCDGCFLKDQADQSRAIGDNPLAVEFWDRMQREFPKFGGQDHPGYTQLWHELPTRLAIEAALREGREPQDDGRLPPKRFLNVLRQERRRHEEGPSQWSCACESKMGDEV